MSDGTRRIDARGLKAQLHDGGEIALLDAREEGNQHVDLLPRIPDRAPDQGSLETLGAPRVEKPRRGPGGMEPPEKVH